MGAFLFWKLFNSKWIEKLRFLSGKASSSTTLRHSAVSYFDSISTSQLLSRRSSPFSDEEDLHCNSLCLQQRKDDSFYLNPLFQSFFNSGSDSSQCTCRRRIWPICKGETEELNSL